MKLGGAQAPLGPTLATPLHIHIDIDMISVFTRMRPDQPVSGCGTWYR